MNRELKKLASILSDNKAFREVYLSVYSHDVQCIGLYGALREFIKQQRALNNILITPIGLEYSEKELLTQFKEVMTSSN